MSCICGPKVAAHRRPSVPAFNHALRNAFDWLAYDLVDRIGVTISFGTVERALDPLTELFERICCSHIECS